MTQDNNIKQTSEFSKKFVIIVLFVLPLVAYLFFLNGEHHFKTLPVVTQQVQEINQFTTLSGSATQLKDSVTVITFIGNQPYNRLGYISNINEKCYKKFHEFNTFQLISVVPESATDQVAQIINELQSTTDLKDWHFITGTNQQIIDLFASLQTDGTLNTDLSSDLAYIIDTDGNLRGRNNDEKKQNGMIYGYDTTTAAALNNRMIDDMRVLLAEYRFAFKKNRDKQIQHHE